MIDMSKHLRSEVGTYTDYWKSEVWMLLRNSTWK